MVKLLSKNSNLCDHNPPTSQTDRQTDRPTDRQTTCDRNTALCTEVHRAVKSITPIYIVHHIYTSVKCHTFHRVMLRAVRYCCRISSVCPFARLSVTLRYDRLEMDLYSSKIFSRLVIAWGVRCPQTQTSRIY